MRSVDESNNKSPLSVIAKMNAGDYCPPAAVSDLQVTLVDFTTLRN